MLDSGASKSCLNPSAIQFNQNDVIPDSTQILSANETKLANLGAIKTSIRYGNHADTICLILIDGLSYPAIIGMDHINELNIDKNRNFTILNGQQLEWNKPNETKFGKCSSYVTIEPAINNFIQVENPYSNSPFACVQVNHPDLTSSYLKDVHINSMVCNNDPLIKICVSSLSCRDIKLNKGTKLCSISPLPDTATINAIHLVHDTKEDLSCIEFQKQRKAKFFTANTKIKTTIGDELSTIQKTQLEKLINDYNLAFSTGSDDIGKLHFYRFSLDKLDENVNCYEPPRPIPYGVESKVQTQIDSWINQGIISPTSSPNNIPLIIIKKGDGTVRTSLDARKLNLQLKDDKYPLPHMRELIHKIGRRITSGDKCFITSCDLSKGYWQVQLKDEDQQKMAFSYDNKQYKCHRALYGVKTIPSGFARIMSEIFNGIPGLFLYLDDISLVSSSWEEHLSSLQILFEKCIEYGINLSPAKCKFGISRMDFLGFSISRNGVNVTSKHTDSIKNYPVPANRQQLKSFLGLCAFNSHLVPNSTSVLAPLYTLSSPKSDWNWTQLHQNAFETFKANIVNSVGLSHRDVNAPLYLCTDASLDKGAGVLYQLRNDQFEALGYHSFVFNNAERKLSSRHRELLAITFSVRHFSYDLYGNKFTVITDHASLRHIFTARSKSELSMKLTNALIYLMNYDFDVIHKSNPDPMITVSDVLSRTPITKTDLEELSQRSDVPCKIFHLKVCPGTPQAAELLNEKSTVDFASHLGVLTRAQKRLEEKPDFHDSDDKISIEEPEDKPESIIFSFGNSQVNRDELSKLQKEDSYLRDIFEKLEKKSKTPTKKFFLDKGCLMNKSKDSNRFVLPDHLAQEYLQYLHIFLGHLGQNKMIKMANRYIWCHDIQSKANNVVKQCESCIRAKPAKRTPPIVAPPRHFESMPWAKVHIDLWDAGQSDRRGKRYLLGITDELTSYTDGIPLASKHEPRVAEALLELIFRYGIFDGTIISDNGREWSSIWDEVTRVLKIRHVRTSPYHSGSNGKIERRFRDLNMILRAHNIDIKQWSENIRYVLFLINNTPKDALGGLTPSECLFGRSIDLPLNVEENKVDVDVPFTKALNKYLQSLHPKLMELHYKRYSQSMKQTAGISLSIGAQVFVYKPSVTNGKLSTQYSGPFTVTKRVGSNVYDITDKSNGKIYRRNIRHLRLLSPSSKLTIVNE